MSIHLRQVALVASDIDAVTDDLCAVFGLQVCHIDPELAIWGLENRLLPVANDFIEVVSPVQPDTAAGRYLERRAGDGGYMVICQADSRDTQSACRERAAALGVRVAYESEEREGFSLMQLHPRDLEAAFFEIDWDAACDTSGRWEPAGGTDWKCFVNTSRLGAITGVELQCEDPPALAKVWAEIAGAAVQIKNGDPLVALDKGYLRFTEIRDGRGPGLGGIDLQVTDRDVIIRDAESRNCHVSGDQVSICGTRFYLT